MVVDGTGVGNYLGFVGQEVKLMNLVGLGTQAQPPAHAGRKSQVAHAHTDWTESDRLRHTPGLVDL